MYFSHLIRFVTFVVLSCAGISAQAEEKHSDGLLCSSIYFIMSGFYGDNKEACEMMKHSSILAFSASRSYADHLKTHQLRFDYTTTVLGMFCHTSSKEA